MLEKEFLNNLYGVGLDLAWCHWNRLGISGSGKMNICSTDPEATLILTALLSDKDLRLVDVVSEWLDNYGELISTERLKTYIKELSTKNKTVDKMSGVLADMAMRQGTNRWNGVLKLLGRKRGINHLVTQKGISRKKLEQHEKIIQLNPQLFLRLFFGVGTRADIIYYMIVVFGEPKSPFNPKISSSFISKMLHYNNSSIHRTLCDLENSGFLIADIQKMLKLTKNVDKSYVDWWRIVQIFCLVLKLDEEICEVKNDAIIKSRIWEFVRSCSVLIDEVGIDNKTINDTTVSLKDVSVHQLQEQAIMLINNIYLFVTS